MKALLKKTLIIASTLILTALLIATVVYGKEYYEANKLAREADSLADIGKYEEALEKYALAGSKWSPGSLSAEVKTKSQQTIGKLEEKRKNEIISFLKGKLDAEGISYDWSLEECITYIAEEKEAYWQVQLHENHSGSQCGEPTGNSPLIDMYRVDSNTRAVTWYSVIEDKWLPLEDRNKEPEVLSATIEETTTPAPAPAYYPSPQPADNWAQICENDADLIQNLLSDKFGDSTRKSEDYQNYARYGADYKELLDQKLSTAIKNARLLFYNDCLTNHIRATDWKLPAPEDLL